MEQDRKIALINKIKQIRKNDMAFSKEFPASDNIAKNKYVKTWISVIFVDIVGYTEKCKNWSEERVIRMVREFQEGILEIMRNYKLKHIQIQGDGIFGVLPTPKQDCDNARKIFECSMDINGFLSEIWSENDYKIAIAMKEETMVVVGNENEREIVFAGGAVNEAKKMMHETHEKNKILISNVFFNNNQEILNEKDYVNNLYGSNMKTSDYRYTLWNERKGL